MKTILMNTARYWLTTLAADTTQARLPEADLQGIVRTVEMAVEYEDPDLWSLALELANAIQSHMQRHGTWAEWDSFVLYMIARARERGDRRGEGQLLLLQGGVGLNRRDRAASIKGYRQALRIFKELEDDQRLGVAYSNLGYLYMTLGAFWRAEVLNERAIALFTLSGDARRLAYTENHLGLTYLEQQRWDEAESHLNRARKLMEQVGDAAGLSLVLQVLGKVHVSAGRLEQALALYNEVLDRYEQLGDKARAAMVLQDMGILYRQQGSLDRAEQVYTQAEAIYQTIGDGLHLAMMRNNLGMLYTQLENWVEAERCFQRALEHWRAEKDELNLANTLGELAGLYIAWQRPLQARTVLTEADMLIEDRDDGRSAYTRLELRARWQALESISELS